MQHMHSVNKFIVINFEKFVFLFHALFQLAIYFFLLRVSVLRSPFSSTPLSESGYLQNSIIIQISLQNSFIMKYAQSDTNHLSNQCKFQFQQIIPNENVFSCGLKQNSLLPSAHTKNYPS